MIKTRIVRGLLRLYPAAWRDEYGAELGALLTTRRLTPYVVFDVCRGAARVRARRAEIWQISGAALFAGTICAIYVNNTTRVRYGWYPLLFNVILVLTGCLTALREPGKSPSWTAAKAAMLGYIPELAVFAFWIAGIFIRSTPR